MEKTFTLKGCIRILIHMKSPIQDIYSLQVTMSNNSVPIKLLRTTNIDKSKALQNLNQLLCAFVKIEILSLVFYYVFVIAF